MQTSKILVAGQGKASDESESAETSTKPTTAAESAQMKMEESHQDESSCPSALSNLKAMGPNCEQISKAILKDSSGLSDYCLLSFMDAGETLAFQAYDGSVAMKMPVM